MKMSENIVETLRVEYEESMLIEDTEIGLWEELSECTNEELLILSTLIFSNILHVISCIEIWRENFK